MDCEIELSRRIMKWNLKCHILNCERRQCITLYWLVSWKDWIVGQSPEIAYRRLMRGRGSGDKAGCLATRELSVPFSAVFVYIVYMDGDRVRVRVCDCVCVCV